MKKIITFTLTVMLALSLTACDFFSDIFNKEPTETPDSRQKFATTPQETPAPTPQETPSRASALDDDGYFLFTREDYTERLSELVNSTKIKIVPDPEGFRESTLEFPFFHSLLSVADDGYFAGSVAIYFDEESDKVFSLAIMYDFGRSPTDDADLIEAKSMFFLSSTIAAGFDLSEEEMSEIFSDLSYEELDGFGTKSIEIDDVLFYYIRGDMFHVLTISSPLWDELLTLTPQETPSSHNDVTYEITYAEVISWTDELGYTYHQALVEILNTGTVPLYLSTGAFDIEDINGTLIRSSSFAPAYPDIIEPGERGYYYERLWFDSEIESELVLLPRPNIKKANVEGIRLNVTDVSITEAQYFGANLLCRVENTHDKELSTIYVITALYDEDDVPITVFISIISETLKPGDKIGFEDRYLVLPTGITLDDVARYEIYAYPMQFQFD